MPYEGSTVTSAVLDNEPVHAVAESSSLYTVIVPLPTDTLLRIARNALRTVRSLSVSVPSPVLSNFRLRIASAVCAAVRPPLDSLIVMTAPLVPDAPFTTTVTSSAPTSTAALGRVKSVDTGHIN